MKDILDKLTQIEASVPKKGPRKKKTLKESLKGPKTLKDVFNELNENLAPGQKPMPVVNKTGSNQNMGQGFVDITGNDPAAQALQNALGTLSTQNQAKIVMPNQQQQPNQMGQPQQNNNNGGGSTIQTSSMNAQQSMSEAGNGPNHSSIIMRWAKKVGMGDAGVKYLKFSLKNASPEKLESACKFLKKIPNPTSHDIATMNNFLRRGNENQELDESTWKDKAIAAALAAALAGLGAEEYKHQVERGIGSHPEDYQPSKEWQDEQDVRNPNYYGAIKEEDDEEVDEGKFKNAFTSAAALAAAAAVSAGNADYPSGFNSDIPQEYFNLYSMTQHEFPDSGDSEGNTFDYSHDRAGDRAGRNMDSHSMWGRALSGRDREEGDLNEREESGWKGNTKLNPAKKGMFNGKSKAELEKQLSALKKSGPHKKGSPQYTKEKELNFALRAKSGWKKNVKEADLPSTAGVDTRGAQLGAGRSDTTLEGRYPTKQTPAMKALADKAEADAANEKKKTKMKKPIKESLDNKLSAAHHRGYADGLAGHAYAGRNHDDVDEGQAYHDGYKAGLDECYGMSTPPATVSGMADQMVDEGSTIEQFGGIQPAEQLEDIRDEMKELAYQALSMVPREGGMYERARSYWYGQILSAIGDPQYPRGSMHSMEDTINEMLEEPEEDEVDEGNAFTGGLARTPRNGHFKVAGNTFTNTTGTIDENDLEMFESWDKELKQLVNENKKSSKQLLSEGMTVSISKGNQGAPDSVNVTATDEDSDKLLALVKQAGLGIFGGEDPIGSEAPRGMSAQANPEINQDTPNEIEVVDDNPGMLDLMKKLSGVETAGANDYDEDSEFDDDDAGSDDDHFGSDDDHADFGSNEDEDDTCENCGQVDCECDDDDDDDSDDEDLDEMESEDQMTAQMGEDNAPDSGAQDTAISSSGNTGANMAAANYDMSQDKSAMAVKENERQLDEWANDAGKNNDESWEADIDFMTQVISGGLNKQKSTGQSTVPVIAGQHDRMRSHNTTDINESRYERTTPMDMKKMMQLVEANSTPAKKNVIKEAPAAPKAPKRPRFKGNTDLGQSDMPDNPTRSGELAARYWYQANGGKYPNDSYALAKQEARKAGMHDEKSIYLFSYGFTLELSDLYFGHDDMDGNFHRARDADGNYTGPQYPNDPSRALYVKPKTAPRGRRNEGNDMSTKKLIAHLSKLSGI